MQVADLVRNTIVEKEYNNEFIRSLFNSDDRATETMQSIAKYIN